MISSNLPDIYTWGIRSAMEDCGPKELKAPWYDCDQQKKFKNGRIKGKKLALRQLITGESTHDLNYNYGLERYD